MPFGGLGALMAKGNRGGNRSGRSNMYSKSKYTNWSPFDPFSLETEAPAKNPPSLVVEVGEGFPIFVRELHPGFVRPVEAACVHELLSRVPADFLAGLDSVTILGGTSKQLKSHLVRYGTYCPGRIFLHAFKARIMSQYWGRKPKPSYVEEYRRAGAEWRRVGSGWRLEFTTESLRQFYLYDVLLHELGHHVDDRAWTSSVDRAERFAEWFAIEQARRLKEIPS